MTLQLQVTRKGYPGMMQTLCRNHSIGLKTVLEIRQEPTKLRGELHRNIKMDLRGGMQLTHKAVIFQRECSPPKIGAGVHSPTGRSTKSTSTSPFLIVLPTEVWICRPSFLPPPLPTGYCISSDQDSIGPQIWCQQVLEWELGGFFLKLQVPFQDAWSISPGPPGPSKLQPISHCACPVFVIF